VRFFKLGRVFNEMIVSYTFMSKKLFEISSHSIPESLERSAGNYVSLFPWSESFLSLLKEARRCKMGRRSVNALKSSEI